MDRRAALIAVLAVLLLASPAGAVTLMVNGDTPSVRYQRWADRSRVPMPSGVVNLYLTPCPDIFREGVAEACVDVYSSPPKVWLTPDWPTVTRPALFHELGHVFDEQNLTTAARDRFGSIWRRPVIDWWAELRPYAPLGPILGGPDGSMGEPSAAAEWFADAYQLCALNHVAGWQNQDIVATAAAYLPVVNTYLGELRSQRRAIATCRLIRGVIDHDTLR